MVGLPNIDRSHVVKDVVADLLQRALDALIAEGKLPLTERPAIRVEHARDRGHADLASNVALTLAKPARRPPRELAEEIVAALPGDDRIDRIEIAGPGFINFFLATGARNAIVRTILEAGATYGHSDAGAGRSIQVEFVSANPTGPLHVGHGRGAALGASVANLLAATGWRVEREYYVNDAGRQMDILALSVWLRYIEAHGEAVAFPANGYHGAYVRQIAGALQAKEGDGLVHAAASVAHELPPDAGDGGDAEAHIDALVERARTLLGDDGWERVFETGRHAMVENIRQDLAEFGVVYDRWFAERGLYTGDAVERTLERLRRSGHVYSHDGAEWFRASAYGDEKDRVVVRDNGQTTYFASDIAYHLDKLERGFDRLINVWGADHHGYVARMQGALRALTDGDDRLEILLVQFATLYRGGEKIPMSTRAGEFVTLRELREEVGNDAARFFYVLRRCDQHLEFDLDLAKAESQDNPVYYIQYAHARIASVFSQLEARAGTWDRGRGLAHLDRLGTHHETELLAALERFPEVIAQAAANREPHRICYYLLEDVANAFHTWYNAETFLVTDETLRDARLALVAATGQVIRNGLELIGVSAPESM